MMRCAVAHGNSRSEKDDATTQSWNRRPGHAQGSASSSAPGPLRLLVGASEHAYLQDNDPLHQKAMTLNSSCIVL